MPETRAEAILRLWWQTEWNQARIAEEVDTEPSRVSQVLLEAGIRSKEHGRRGHVPCGCGRAHVEYKGLCRRCAQAKQKKERPEGKYGHFPGGDPREFTPDPGAADFESLRSWMQACVKGERVNEAEGRSFGLGYFPDRIRIIPLS